MQLNLKFYPARDVDFDRPNYMDDLLEDAVEKSLKAKIEGYHDDSCIIEVVEGRELSENYYDAQFFINNAPDDEPPNWITRGAIMVKKEKGKARGVAWIDDKDIQRIKNGCSYW